MKKKAFQFIWGSIFLIFWWSSLVCAQSAFTGTSGTITRQSLGLYGGHAEDLAIASNGNLYLALNSPNGCFCSTNGAASWYGPPTGSDFGSVSAVEIGETDDTIYIIGGIKLYKSTNACGTFDELTIQGVTSDFGQTMGYYDDGSQPVLLISYRDGTIYKSTDYGSSFTNITIDANVSSILELAASPTGGTFYALTVDTSSTVTIYRSIDYGNTWNNIGTSLNCNDCDTFKVNPSDANEFVAAGLDSSGLTTVHISTDGGSTWTDVSTNHGGGIKQFISFDGSRIYVGSKYTDDDGANWTDYNDSITSSDTGLLGFFTKDPNSSTTLYMNSMRGFAKSTDGGATWSDSVTGLFGVVVSDIAQASDKDIVYLAVTGGIAKSVDFTVAPTWTHPLLLTSSGDTALAVLIVDPYNTTHTTQIVLASSAAGISRSIDGGSNWSQSTISTSLSHGNAVTDFARGALAIYATYKNVDVDTGGVLYSNDNGTTWTDMSLTNNAPANTVATLANYMPLTGTLTFTNGSTSVTGSGTNFLSEVIPGDVIILDADANAVHTQPVAWAVVDSVSSNTAITLGDSYNGTGGSGAGSKVSGDIIIVGAGEESNTSTSLRGIFTTTFDGTSWTWTEITDVDIDGHLINDLVVVASAYTSTIYASSGETDKGSICRSTDGGSSWDDLMSVGTGLPSNGWFHSLAVDTSNTDIVFAASGRPASAAEIYRTVDGGSNWSLYHTALVDEAPNAMLVDGLMVGFNTGLFSFEQSPVPPTSGSEGGGGACFIFTAAHSSPMESFIKVLREFRE